MERPMPIVENHEAMNTPKTNINLWRYMDIPSFLSLISTGSLTFVRADLFEDKFEGTLPKLTAAWIDSDIQQAVDDGILSESYRGFKLSESMYSDRKTVYMNCWCKENHEMVHMWKIYSKENGIAIETNYEQLKESIESVENVYPTEIKYLDYAHDHVEWISNAFTPYTIKRKEYKSEKEFRLIMSRPKIIQDQLSHLESNEERYSETRKLCSQTDVIPCKINVAKLISKIHLSPYAPRWYYKVIIDIVEKYNLIGIEVVQSEL